MEKYDVAIIGAGPVGSTFARYVADEGFNVVMLEKKNEVGVPLQCAGLLGKKIKDLNLLPEKYILNSVNGAYLHSPMNRILKVGKDETEAYVIDRVGYDKFLAEQAVNAGADLFLHHKVNHLDVKTGEICVGSNGKNSFRSKIIVGADGHTSITSRNFNPPSRNVQAAQYLVNVGDDSLDTNNVHLYVDDRLSPGFLWVIPISKSLARIGLFGNIDYKGLNNILNEFINSETLFKNASIEKKYHGFIPIYDSKKEIVKDRVLLLGDAASQIKPTTGGGLMMGFECAKMAAKTVSKALNMDDLKILSNYESDFKNRFKGEIRAQFEVQNIFKSLNNDDLDQMFLKLKEGNAEEIISKYGDMDTQSTLIKEMIKNRMILSILPRLLTRRIRTLWK